MCSTPALQLFSNKRMHLCHEIRCAPRNRMHPFYYIHPYIATKTSQHANNIAVRMLAGNPVLHMHTVAPVLPFEHGHQCCN